MTLACHYLPVALSRLRSLLLKTRGATVEPKVSIGSGVRFDNPATMSFGFRVTLEQYVYLKVVSESAQLSVGSWSFLGKGVEIDCQEHIHIGEHVLISPGCFITDHNHGILAGKRIDQQMCIANAVTIENDVWVGANAVILPGVQVGKGAVVGAGSVVTHNVKSYDIVAGVPAKSIGHRGDLL